MRKIDLTGKTAFIAGVGDDKGLGFAIAKELAEAGATILIGTWPPLLNILKKSIQSGRMDEALTLSDGSKMQIEGIYPLDAAYDNLEEVPVEVSGNKRYLGIGCYTISDVAEEIGRQYGRIDILVHSLANSPEAKKPLLETTRAGYLSTLSASSYSLVSLVKHFGPIMPEGASVLTLTYLAAERVVPGYGGGLNAAKAALESDMRYLAYEAGNKWKLRVNAISAGAYASRAAKAIGFIDQMVEYSVANSPLDQSLKAEEVGMAALFLLSPLTKAITGEVIHVDHGLHAMGVGVDSPAFLAVSQV